MKNIKRVQEQFNYDSLRDKQIVTKAYEKSKEKYRGKFISDIVIAKCRQILKKKG